MDTAALGELQELLKSGQHERAYAIAKPLAEANRQDGNCWFLFANAARATGKAEEARAAINQALLSQPFHPAFHAMQAEMWQDAGNLAEAEAAYQRALTAKPDFLPALSALGVMLMDQGRLASALEPLRRCAELRPSSTQYQNNLGTCFLAMQRFADAETHLREALRFDPSHTPAHYNFARLLIAQGRDQEAIPHLEAVLAKEPDHAEVLYLFGALCQRNGDYQSAYQFLSKAAARPNSNALITHALAEFCWEQGDVATSRALNFASLQTSPQNLKAHFGAHLALPMVYSSLSELEESRKNFSAGLDSIESVLPTLKNQPRPVIERDIQWANFLLAYQGRDDKALQQRFAAIIHDLLRSAAPEYCEEPRQPSARRNRIGFISNNFTNSTVGHYFQSWITQLDATKFEKYVYHANLKRDSLTDAVQRHATKFVDAGTYSLFALAKSIVQDQLDVLIFPELGMHPLLFALASMRLAPVQCAAWGHPVTSGHATIDHYLSVDTMEPENAQAHYSESLHLLPGMGTHYGARKLPAPLPRASLGLPETGNLYLVPQSLFKIHPDNDALLLDVIERDPSARLVMFATERHRIATRIFVQRLNEAAKARNLPVDGRLHFLPFQGHQSYLQINQACDVMVDTLHWSGGNTSIDALATALPLVTHEGSFMRGRQSAAMLRMVGSAELIAANKDELVTKVLAIGTNPDHRESVRAQLRGQVGALFEQRAPIQALEEFLSAVTAGQ